MGGIMLATPYSILNKIGTNALLEFDICVPNKTHSFDYLTEVYHWPCKLNYMPNVTHQAT